MQTRGGLLILGHPNRKKRSAGNTFDCLGGSHKKEKKKTRDKKKRSKGKTMAPGTGVINKIKEEVI